jgi:hypothetical protein
MNISTLEASQIGERRNQQVELARMVGGWLQLDGSIKPRRREIRLGRHYREPETGYETLADNLYFEFLTQLKFRKRTEYRADSIHHSFRVIGRMLGYAPEAYQSYCIRSDIEQSIPDLQETLRRSANTANMFARMDGTRNGIYERVMGLSTEHPLVFSPFTISTERADGPHYVPEPSLKAAADQWLKNQSDDWWQGDKDAPAWRQCPARERFITAVWHAAIDRAAADPSLFAADLGGYAST